MKRLLLFIFLGSSLSYAHIKDCVETGSSILELKERTQAKGWDIENKNNFFVGKVRQTFAGTWHDEDGYGIGLIPVNIKGFEEESYTVLILDERFNSPYASYAQREVDNGRDNFAVKKSCLNEVPKNTRRRMRFLAERILKTNPPFVYRSL
jgi:hypothetical protein